MFPVSVAPCISSVLPLLFLRGFNLQHIEVIGPSSHTLVSSLHAATLLSPALVGTWSTQCFPVSFHLQSNFARFSPATKQLLDQLHGHSALHEHTTCTTGSFLHLLPRSHLPELELTISSCLLLVVFNKFTFNLLPVWCKLLDLLQNSSMWRQLCSFDFRNKLTTCFENEKGASLPVVVD